MVSYVTFVVLVFLNFVFFPTSTSGQLDARKFASKMEPMATNVADAMPVHIPPVSSNSVSSFSFQKLFKSFVSMLTGKSSDGESATKQIIGLLLSLIDTLKQTFTSRAMQARSQGSNTVSNDAVATGLTFLKAYVRSIATQEDSCVQKYICEANREAVDRASDLGHLMGTASSSAIGFLLERSNIASSEIIADASWKGRRREDCNKIYALCTDDL